MTRLLTVLMFVLLTPLAAHAQGEKLAVGVTPVEPFVIKNEDGSYDGISIQLWEDIAKVNGYQYEYIELPLTANLDQVQRDRVDVALGAISITKEREEILDFTHTFYNSGLGILTKRNTEFGFTDLLMDWSFWKSVLLLVGFVFAGGLLIIMFENGTRNPDFKYNNIGNGVWWSIVTITTTGYGDLVPKTTLGRFFASIWMVFGAILAPSLIGNLAANTTIEQQKTIVMNKADLPNHKIGVIQGTSTVEYFRENHLPFVEVQNVQHMISMIRSGEISGGVYDAPMLRYHSRRFADLAVLPDLFDRQNYGIALQSGSPLREEINAQLLTEINDFTWVSTMNRYLGE